MPCMFPFKIFNKISQKNDFQLQGHKFILTEYANWQRLYKCINKPYYACKVQFHLIWVRVTSSKGGYEFFILHLYLN